VGLGVCQGDVGRLAHVVSHDHREAFDLRESGRRQERSERDQRLTKLHRFTLHPPGSTKFPPSSAARSGSRSNCCPQKTPMILSSPTVASRRVAIGSATSRPARTSVTGT